ncbi:MAG: radical protein [Clostridia bacterium]|jgi:histone acetyltransferase (RNA polymerase elongator complex component)|nr:radical protein [Clostridia bacterium]
MSKRHYIIPVFVSHRGCPHDCIFCNQKKITGSGGDVSGIEVKEKIEEYLKTMPLENSHIELAFFGGSFTAIPIEQQKELLEAAQPYLKQGFIKNIRVSTRPDCIDEEVISILKLYGVQIVELGVQSLDEEVLRISNRGHSVQSVIDSVNLLKEHGFTVGVQVMVGLPGDNEEKSIATVKRLVGLKPHIARIYPALVIRNTYMEKMYERGLYKPLSLESAVEICKKLLIIFEQNNIEVIRIGLQPTEEIGEGKEVAAGPFHPSMRQLVVSSIYRDMLENIINDMKPVESIEIEVNSKEISDIIGQKRTNIDFLSKKYKLKKIAVIQSPDIEKQSITVKSGEIERNLSVKDFYKLPVK